MRTRGSTPSAGSDRLRVVVDRELCEGNARCVQIAPAVFRLADDVDTVQVIPAQIAAELREKIETAVALCPRQALSLVDE